MICTNLYKWVKFTEFTYNEKKKQYKKNKNAQCTPKSQSPLLCTPECTQQ